MNPNIQIVDLFSGPGGLAEGFCSSQLNDRHQQFQVAVSVEKDAAAHRTLTLRSFLRNFEAYPQEYYEWLAGRLRAPDWSELYPDEWKRARAEVWHAELGRTETAEKLSKRIEEVQARAGKRTLLIGGPPCQAYSLVGRARNAGIKTYVASDDHRHFLYKEYCRVLTEFSPSVFVMENVKGMLSSTVAGSAIFGAVLNDLESAGDGYALFALSGADRTTERPSPSDFIVRAEDYGVPQARHRVFIVGIKKSIASKMPQSALPTLAKVEQPALVRNVLKNMPKLRSGLSRGDDRTAWYRALDAAIQLVRNCESKYSGGNKNGFLKELKRVAASIHKPDKKRTSGASPRWPKRNLTDLAAFLFDERLEALSCNETRGHMDSDLARYLFASCFAKAERRSPKAPDFPSELAPKHANWDSGKFSDRFRVQCWDAPATTITSHISKDGHYYIHPDASQCRSLTVREAARLQTFPDNYHFLGNRTQQFSQIGNAVPPFLAKQIADALAPVFKFIDELDVSQS